MSAHDDERGGWYARPEPPAPKRLGDVLPEVTRGLGLPDPSTIRELRAAWPDLVGGQIASHSHPRTLRDRVWGQGLPPPAFDDAFAVEGQRVIGERHLRMTLVREGERFEGIAFNHPPNLPARIHALYRPEVGEWNGLLSLELVVDHWEPAV